MWNWRRGLDRVEHERSVYRLKVRTRRRRGSQVKMCPSTAKTDPPETKPTADSPTTAALLLIRDRK